MSALDALAPGNRAVGGRFQAKAPRTHTSRGLRLFYGIQRGKRGTDTPATTLVTYGDAVTTARPLLAATLSAVLLASGAIGSAAVAAPTSPAPARDVPPQLASFYGQALDWQPCARSMQCAWLSVPLDYANPQGQAIGIRVSKVPASGSSPTSRQGSLVVNPGGPGASGLDFASYVAASVAPEVGEQFDVVGFDPRGVGESAPITCMTGRQTTRWLTTDLTPDSASEQRTVMTRARQLAQGCLRMSPDVARFVGSDLTVQDLDILRAALGDDKLNLLGFSYGTYLATLYAEQFPDTVGRFVLDGAVDPSLDIMGVSEAQSRGFQVAMARFAKDCAPRPTCAWRGSSKAVLKGINRLLADLETKPLPARKGRPLVQADAVTSLFYSMYSPILWPTLRQALTRATRGDGLPLQRLADFANDKSGPNSYASNMASAFPAISCSDTPPAPDAAGLAAAAARWSRKAAVPVMAQTMSWSNAPCSVWYGHASRTPAPASSTTTAPILIVGTTYDPATPYAWARALTAQLPTSMLLTYRGDGHTAYGNGARCVDSAVNAYLLTGVLPPPGVVCPG